MEDLKIFLFALGGMNVLFLLTILYIYLRDKFRKK